MKKRPHPQRGSAIIMLFVAVALFGLISYAFLQGTRGNVNIITSEADKAGVTASQDCSNAINLAQKRLTARGCEDLVSINQDGSNTNPGAPTDGSCSVFHSNGGGVKPCSSNVTCDLTALAIGEACDGLYYIGNSNGRLYTNGTNGGNVNFNNGFFMATNFSGLLSLTDGKANTDYLVSLSDSGSPYAAAQACRALGPEWYLPSRDEAGLMNTNRALLPFLASQWWTSSSAGGTSIYRIINGVGNATANQYNPLAVAQCVRRDN